MRFVVPRLTRLGKRSRPCLLLFLHTEMQKVCCARLKVLVVPTSNSLADRVLSMPADLGQNDPWMAEVAVRLNVNVISYDYTGYGLNGTVGECSESVCSSCLAWKAKRLLLTHCRTVTLIFGA